MDIQSKIEQRRRQLLVHSYIYYELDDNVIDDDAYNRWSKELVELQLKYPKESSRASYYQEFKNFTGDTGFDLDYRKPNIINTAEFLIKCRNEDLKNG